VKKSSLRAYQDRAANAGWRIQLIAHDDPSKAMRIQTNWYALAGAVVFSFGFCGAWFGFGGPEQIYYAALAGGFGFALLSVLLAGRARRRGWLRIKAACLDRECHGGVFRLRCGFELDGRAYTVTPAPFWRNFNSDQTLQRFLGRVIGNDGMCCLRVNPGNPLQTELAGGDLADILLFWR
jgi:hypothetical protein